MRNNTKGEEEIHFEKEAETLTQIYTDEIRFLDKEADRILTRARKQEEHMNELEKVDKYHIKELGNLVQTFLRILSVKDAYKYFMVESEPLTDENIGKFVFVSQNYYLLRFIRFKNDMKNQIQIQNRNRNRNEV